MEKIIIIGGKSSATLIADNLYDAQHRFNVNIECLGFAFDDLPIGTNINGYPVIAKSKNIYNKFKNIKDVKFIYQSYDIKDMKKAIFRKK